MIVKFKCLAIMHVETEYGAATGKVTTTDTSLSVDKPIDVERYLNDDGYTVPGVNVMLNSFCLGIAGIIKHAHARGLFTESELIRYVHATLAKEFANSNYSLTIVEKDGTQRDI
jgi:hypothetical protein